MKVLNKIFAIILIGFVITASTGCSAKESKLAHDVMDTVKDKAKNFAKEKWADIEEWATEDDGYVDPETEKMLNQASVVMESFQSNDEESLFMLFNEYIRKNYKEKLEDDINGVFDLVEGDIISFDKPSIYVSSKTTDENGILIRCQYVSIYNICTDKGKRYEIEFEFYDVNKKHQDGVGISTFSISDSDEYTEENDFPSDAVYTFGDYGDTYDAVLNY